MILSELSEIPEDGSSFEMSCYGLDIKVEKVEDRRIASAILSKTAE
jgi:CBS domain containing-hemolysin-like protein